MRGILPRLRRPKRPETHRADVRFVLAHAAGVNESTSLAIAPGRRRSTSQCAVTIIFHQRVASRANLTEIRRCQIH